MSEKLFTLEDDVVLISGASRGIGEAIAAAFVSRGARVIITGRDGEVLEKNATGMSTGKHPVEWMVCDVADEDAIRTCVEKAIATHDAIDTLFNVAGVNRRGPAEDYTAEDYDFIVDINLRGAFLMSREVARHMIPRRKGIQVNIDSVNTYAPLKWVVPYAMSKAGMQMMTRGLALEWGRSGIRVNGIAPGFILTDLTRKVWSNANMREWNRDVTPMERLGAVDDLVGAAIFLASPASAFITGQTLRVDGGVSAGINWPIEKAAV